MDKHPYTILIEKIQKGYIPTESELIVFAEAVGLRKFWSSLRDNGIKNINDLNKFSGDVNKIYVPNTNHMMYKNLAVRLKCQLTTEAYVNLITFDPLPIDKKRGIR